MMKQTKQYKITILDHEYSLMSDEPESHVQNTVQHVDALMKEVLEKSRLADQTKVAVLAALRLASELLHLQEEKKRDLQDCKHLIERMEHKIDSVQSAS